MKLLDTVGSIEQDHVIWRTPDQDITAGETQKTISARRSSSELPRDARVAIEVTETTDAITWMIALDGVVEAVFLVPASLLNSHEYDALRLQAKCTHAVCPVGLRALSETTQPNLISDKAQAPDTKWILATSGTTGTPKLIEHTTESLTRTSKKNLKKGRAFTWGLVYDPFRFAGLQVVLQALSSGSTLVVCTALESVRDIAKFLRDSNVNALSATPSYWRRLLMTGLLAEHDFKQITLGGEPADQTVLDALKKEFPTARIVHIYASTEAGVGFAIKDGMAGFPAELVRHSEGDKRYAISSTGTLLIGTGDNPSEYLDTGDLVEERDGRIQFLGRDSGAINVGGNKVVPEQVESVIRSVPGVAEVLVKPKRSGMMGQLVSAEVSSAQGVEDVALLRKQIIAHCRATLASYQVPAFIRFVEQIPVNSSGKVIRK